MVKEKTTKNGGFPPIKFCKKERNDSLLNGLFDISYFISPFDVIQEQTDMFLFFAETILFLIYLVLPLTDHK